MNLSNIETWCARRGLVMKDFPDRLIAQAATTGDTGLLDAWLENNEPRTRVAHRAGWL